MKLTDDRTGVLGATFHLEPLAAEKLCTALGVDPNTPITVHLTDMNPDGGIGSVRPSEDAYDIIIDVSDRLEFSEAAVRRVNRNLGHVLRHVGQHATLVALFGPMLGTITQVMAVPAMCEEAYRAERKVVKEDPITWALLPDAVVLADDPQGDSDA